MKVKKNGLVYKYFSKFDNSSNLYKAVAILSVFLIYAVIYLQIFHLDVLGLSP